MKKSFETILYSSLGVFALLLILIAVNFLAGRFPQRIDLTADKAYTLSAGTRAILGKLDTPVKIRFYCTRNENMPPQLKLYAQQVEDLLGEYRQASRGFVQIQKLDPEPDSDAEDSARLDGVEPQRLSDGESLYLGLSVSMLDQKQAVPFLSPDRERLLEYDISRAISRVSDSGRKVVGIMSALPVEGMPASYMDQGAQDQQPWVLYSELNRDYTLRQIAVTADKIPDDVNVLLLIHPRGITDAAQYAIDQYLLRGGKLIAFLDPNAVLDRQQPQESFMPQTSSSNIEKLLKAWGITFNSSQVVADMTYLGRTSRGRAPGVLELNQEAFSKDDIVTADASQVLMAFAGSFSGAPAPGLKEAVLIKSSSNAELVSPMSAETSPDDVINNFVPTNQQYPLAIRLTGTFKTAFPDGEPAGGGKTQTAGLKQSAQPGTVILVGDSDMLQDQIATVAEQNPFGGEMVLPANGNLAFAENAIEQLSGDSDLIAVRSRAARERPFTVVQKMEETAEASYRDKIKELEGSLADTEQKLNELQQHRPGAGDADDERYILSPEQQAELANFRKTEASVKKELKDVRRNLRAATDSLEDRIQWLNIAAMPACVTVAGVALALFKRKRVAAQ